MIVPPSNPLSGTVTLGAIGLPGGATATFNPPTFDLDAAMSSSVSPDGSHFLNDLRDSWRPQRVNYKFFAAAGRVCANANRTVTVGVPFQGCLTPLKPYSDGAVCAESAALTYSFLAGGIGSKPNDPIPSTRWEDPSALYRHAQFMNIPGLNFGPLMCGNDGTEWIVNPKPNFDGFFEQVVTFLKTL